MNKTADGRLYYPCFACGGAKTTLHTDIPNLDTLTASLLPRVAVSICDECGLVQQNPCIPQEKMSGIYERIEDKITLENLAHSVCEEEGRARLAALKALLAPPARLLEVGCSDGTFLALAQEAGYDVRGVDPSEANIAKAKELHPGLDVSVGFAEGLSAAREFDAACHFYVLEHSFAPVAFLKTLRNLLKDGGLMFFEVPDISRFASLPFANFLFPYQHTLHLSPETATDLLAQAGFAPVRLDDHRGLKSYGMRFVARTSAPLTSRTNWAAQSRRHLDAYFGRRRAILADMNASVRRWAQEAAGRRGPCVIFGAGENGRVLLSETPIRKLFPDLAFSDNNTSLHGRTVDGLRVLKPQELPALDPALVITASIDYQEDMARQLESLGISCERIVKLYRRP